MLSLNSQRLLFRAPLKQNLSQTSRLIRTFSTTHTMSTSNKEWLVIIPDKPNSLQKRLAARPLHLEKIKPRIESGEVVFGGATLDEQPAVDGTPGMNGSVMLMKANTEQEIRAVVEADEYAKNDVWDLEKLQIIPFRCAIRTAL